MIDVSHLLVPSGMFMHSIHISLLGHLSNDLLGHLSTDLRLSLSHPTASPFYSRAQTHAFILPGGEQTRAVAPQWHPHHHREPEGGPVVLASQKPKPSADLNPNRGSRERCIAEI